MGIIALNRRNESLILLFLLITILIIGPLTAQAQQEYPQPENKIVARGGYFLPYRGEFKDIYGSQFNGVLQYERSISERVSIGLEASLIILKKSDFILKYRNISATPFANFCFFESNRSSFFASLGIGLNFRRVSGDFYYSSPEDQPIGVKNTGQNDFGPSMVLGIAWEEMISSRIFIIPKVNYDYIFDPHPELGDFGNTGGFNFTIGAGVHF